MSCSSFRRYGAFVGSAHERGVGSLVGDPHTKTTPSVLGAGKSGVDVSVLGATCVRSGQTGQTPHLFSPHSHSYTAQQQGRNVHVDVHVSPLLAAAHVRFYDIAHILGQRQQCSSCSEKHRENRRSAEYIFRPRQFCRSSSQAQGRHTIRLTMYGLLTGSALVAAASALAIAPRQNSDTSCPGYSASNVETSGTGLSADLSLAGSPCNSYGKDIENLRLTVSYDTCMSSGVPTLFTRY
jgi:hypothetical protein